MINNNKRVLITGVNSYIGNSLKDHIEGGYTQIAVEMISLKDESWRDKDLSQYDSIVHVAGLAHVSNDKHLKEDYYKINRDLTLEIAQKSKEQNVKQFIYISSIIVFGNAKSINKNTQPKPNNFYGDSKLQAEIALLKLENELFKVAIVRPPMVYGKGSKGNYSKLSSLAKLTFLFPDYQNKRSMLYIENLCEFISLIIINEDCGLYHPQNSEYVSTSNLVRIIAERNGRRIFLPKILNPAINKFKIHSNILNKVFGDLYYEMEISEYYQNYRVKSFEQSVLMSENMGGGNSQ